MEVSLTTEIMASSYYQVLNKPSTPFIFSLSSSVMTKKKIRKTKVLSVASDQ